LTPANRLKNGQQWSLRAIQSETGEAYLDFAWPIMEARAGTLRVGLAEAHFRRQVVALWTELAVGALAALAVVILVGAWVARRISEPIKALAQSADQIHAGNLEVAVDAHGDDEIGRLGQAFERMLRRIREHTGRLEETSTELERAYRQTKSSFEILQRLGMLTRLEDMCRCLIDRFREDMACRHFMMVMLTSQRRHLMVFANKTLSVHPPETAVPVVNLLGAEGDDILFVKPQVLPTAIRIEPFASAERVAVFPIAHEMAVRGALMVACREDCDCNTNALEVIDLVLHEAAGGLQRAVQYEEETRQLSAPDTAESFEGLVGKAPEMATIFRIIGDIAPTDASVLVQGESGTGKELVAQAIHRRSLRREAPFMVINCSAYPATLLESELFGHEKGAFTGATQRRLGRFEQAHGGTVFLDEVGEISPSAQIKLLRVLQTQQFERLGGTKTISVDVRVISATNRDLLNAVKIGQFREDLYYRLKVIPIMLPPLRLRRNDIPLLVRHFLQQFANQQGKTIKAFTPEAMRVMMQYDWPGNVRELENSVEHAVVLAKSDHIHNEDLPEAVASPSASPTTAQGSIKANEARLLQETLEACGWNKRQAARKLGISRNTLYRKLRKYRIQTPTIH
jgi:two-component system response regulator HydG